MGIVSNGGSEMQRSKISALGIQSFFQAIIISSEVGLRKPDPAIFDMALEQLACAADQAWFVGDHPDNDVRGAAAGGLRAFWLKSDRYSAQTLPGVVLGSLLELTAYLDATEREEGADSEIEAVYARAALSSDARELIVRIGVAGMKLRAQRGQSRSEYLRVGGTLTTVISR